MTVYGVTAATGQLGRLIVTQLLDAGVPAADIVAIVRSPERATDLASRSVVVRRGDYSEPDTLSSAFTGVEVLMFISGSEVGQRVAQHGAVIDAAKAAGVSRIIYTSVLRADTTALVLAPEHRATEELLRASGLTYTILRNGWYLENYTRQLGDYLQRGVIVGATGDGPIAGAARADYAAAAVATMINDGHDNAIYELGGTRFTLTDLAQTVTDVTGTKVVHQDVTPAELIEILRKAGLDEGTAGFVAALDEGIARGDIDTDSDALATLVGRPLTTLKTTVRAAHSVAA